MTPEDVKYWLGCRRCGMQGRDKGSEGEPRCTYCGIAHPDEQPLLKKLQAELQIMMASAVPEGDAWVTGYQIKTGAIHRIVGLMSGAGFPVSLPAVPMDRLAAVAQRPAEYDCAFPSCQCEAGNCQMRGDQS